MKLYCGRKSHKTSPHHTRTHDAQKHSSSNAQKTQHQRKRSAPACAATREHIEEVWQEPRRKLKAWPQPERVRHESNPGLLSASCRNGRARTAPSPRARGAARATRGRCRPPTGPPSHSASGCASLHTGIAARTKARHTDHHHHHRSGLVSTTTTTSNASPARPARPVPVASESAPSHRRPGRPKRGGPQARSRRHGNAQL